MIHCAWCGGRGIRYDYRSNNWDRCSCRRLRFTPPPDPRDVALRRAIARAEEAEALLEQALTVGREMVTGWQARAEKYARAEGNAVEGEIAANVNAIDLKQQVDRLTEERDEWQARAEKAERERREARAYYSNHEADAHMSRREAERQRDAAVAQLRELAEKFGDAADKCQRFMADCLDCRDVELYSGKSIAFRDAAAYCAQALAAISDHATKKEEP